jgi:predicted nucleic acid-binding protein
MATFVDSNVLIYALNPNSPFFPWASEKLLERRKIGKLLIDQMTYAEVSVGYLNTQSLDATLARMHVDIEPASKQALFNAARAHQKYKARGGTKTNVLPDFLIGANAADRDMPLLTRDVNRFQTYFPTLQLIAPPL